MNLTYPTYRAFVPFQSVGANLVYFDLWNGASGLFLDVYSVVPIVSGANAVSGVVGVDLFLTRTTAVGTGGTAATRSGTSLTAMTISPMISDGDELTGLVTARLTPTGGATAGAVISWASVFTEETSAAPYYAHTNDLARRNQIDVCPIVMKPGSGIRVVQGSVASVGTIGFDVIFQARWT